MLILYFGEICQTTGHDVYEDDQPTRGLDRTRNALNLEAMDLAEIEIFELREFGVLNFPFEGDPRRHVAILYLILGLMPIVSQPISKRDVRVGSILVNKGQKCGHISFRTLLRC
jgi:hypothetical protein